MKGWEYWRTLEEIQRVVAKIDHETLMRAQACSEEAKAEEEAKRECENVVEEELQQRMATTSVERVWRSF